MIPAIAGNPSRADYLQLLLDNTEEVFILIDTSLNIVIFNKEADRSAYEATGKHLFQGEPVLDFASEEQKDNLRILFSSALEGRTNKFKYNLTGKVTLLVTIVPIKDSGTVKFISITAINISAEEQAMLEVSKNQQLMKRAEMIAGLGSWEWDIPSDTIFWSDELYRLLGLEPGTAKPSKELGFSFVHPEDVHIAEETLVHSFKSGKPYNTEIRLIDNSKGIKYIYCQGIVIRNELGRNEKVIGTFHDITSKKLLEESINKQEQRFQSLIESSADLIIQVNEERVIIYVSPAITSMMQYSSEEVIGKRLASLACKDDLPWLMSEFEKILQHPGQPFILQYRVNKKDGTHLWVEGTVTNLLHVPGVNSIVINQRDISQRKEAERLLNQLNDALESRAVELSSSNVELERFAYVASHDLQEPLRMITSFLQLLEKKYTSLLDEKGRQYIHYAVDGAVRMKLLINDLLEYSRAGSKHGQFSELDMNDVVKNVTLLFKTQMDEAGGTIITETLPSIIGERTQILQLFQNLVGNAIKYRSQAAPSIKIGSSETAAEWQFSIEDNGLGIPDKYAEEIFNIFHRLHGKNEYEGTGIGLAICKKIVETHGGKIWVRPAEKQGSMFYFSIKKPATVAEQQF